MAKTEMQKVGIREFRANLADYADADAPVEVTRHGATVGYFVPAPRKWTEEERAAFREAHAKGMREMEEAAITEEDVMAELDRIHEEQKAEERKAEWQTKSA